jgi:hypothetical protein
MSSTKPLLGFDTVAFCTFLNAAGTTTQGVGWGDEIPALHIGRSRTSVKSFRGSQESSSVPGTIPEGLQTQRLYSSAALAPGMAWHVRLLKLK